MKLLRHLLLAAFCGLAFGAAQAQDRELTITVEDLMNDPRLCPTEVVITKRTQVAVGVMSAVYEVGSRLPVARVERELVYVRLGQNFGSIPIADTNLLEAANATFSVARLRQRLIDEANALPDPADEPAASPTPAPDVAVANPGAANPFPTPTPTAAQSQEPFSDEFQDIQALSRWSRITETEGWNIDTMESKSVQSGFLSLQPYSQGWFKDYRGELFYQLIEGDFEIETLVGALNRAGTGPPSSPYSLAGLMLRVPRSIRPETWTPGREQYLFFGIGVGEDPSKPIYEIKLTGAGETRMSDLDAQGSIATLKMVRVGVKVFLLAKPLGGGNWQVLSTIKLEAQGVMQLGFTAHTDWPTVERTPVEQHNRTPLLEGNRDLRAVFDYVRIKRPGVSADAVAGDLGEDEILRLFGK